MRCHGLLSGWSNALYLLIVSAAARDAGPTAVRKLSPDAGEKLLAEHLAFAPVQLSSPFQVRFSDFDDEGLTNASRPRLYLPAFGSHFSDTEDNLLRRAAEALAILERRQSCPPGMNSCASQGSPNKCCMQGTYCTDVPDTDVGHVACCPDDQTCDGAVGACPSDAVTCPPDLGGGCCIPGYVCQGVGCVPKASTTSTSTTKTEHATETVTSIKTTVVEGNPSTVTVTETVVRTLSHHSSTKTTETETETETTSTAKDSGGGAPWRPITTEPATSSDSGDTQSGCPTNFYGCSATHGGGCCRTDRNCDTFSCPAVSSTTLVSNSVTIVVPATGLPSTTASETCADGWSLCGASAGLTPGCCPSGYSCGTASCYTSTGTQTGEVQKEFPDDDGAAENVRAQSSLFAGAVAMALALCLM